MCSGLNNGLCEARMALGSYDSGSGAMSHAYIQYPPFRCDIPGALGVTYDDANKLLLVSTLGEIYSWSVSSDTSPSDPVVVKISQGPVLGVRFSLDCKILAILRSNTEIEFINREDCNSFKQSCKSSSERILGFFWTDCPDCDVVIVTASGLELNSLCLGKGKLKLVEKKKQSVSWFVYTHESRLVLLASGTQCKTLSGYQFSAGGIVRLPKFDANFTKSENHRTFVLSSENVFIATMYGRLYCLQTDPLAKMLHIHRFYRDAVISQGSLPTYASNVSVSVVDNVLLVHQIDSKVVLLYDILANTKVPISAPLPLLLRQYKPANSPEKPGADESSLYGEGWVFVNPDVILDHTHGLLWKIQLDLEAVAASSSDLSSLLAFLQRRKCEAVKAKQLSCSILRSIIMERRSLSQVASALDVLTSAFGHVKRSSSKGTPIGRMSSMPLILTPGMQPAAFATALAISNAAELSYGSLRAGSARVLINGEQEIREPEQESSSIRFSETENQAASPHVSPQEMLDNVFAVIDEGMAVENSFLGAVMVQYLRSARAEQLTIPPGLYVLLVRLLARDKCYARIQHIVADQVIEPSKALALELLDIGAQCSQLEEIGTDMLRQVHAHKDYLERLLHKGRLLEGLRYIRQNKVESPPCVRFLEAAAAKDNFVLLASVLRFCCDFVSAFEHTAEFEKFYSILKRDSSK
ncbi:regulator of MON1-CCZ1 complex [Selaginella moellendorffii]|nr:regulator of MON1-CCZ1 complex [Selaginella moellendorffii]|eukprot:XP_002974407.2 regulator of MON1-CCZ1 complex [Selaginella moellendorffii]